MASKTRLGGHELPPAPTVAQRHHKGRPNKRKGEALMAWLDKNAPPPITYEQAWRAARMLSRDGSGAAFIEKDAWLLLAHAHGTHRDGTLRQYVSIDFGRDIGEIYLYPGVQYVTG